MTSMVQIWQHLKPSESVPATELTVELREGQGLLHLRLEYDSEVSLSSRPSRMSLHSTAASEKPSPSRFSISGRRRGDRDD